MMWWHRGVIISYDKNGIITRKQINAIKNQSINDDIANPLPPNAQRELAVSKSSRWLYSYNVATGTGAIERATRTISGIGGNSRCVRPIATARYIRTRPRVNKLSVCSGLD